MERGVAGLWLRAEGPLLAGLSLATSSSATYPPELDRITGTPNVTDPGASRA